MKFSEIDWKKCPQLPSPFYVEANGKSASIYRKADQQPSLATYYCAQSAHWMTYNDTFSSERLVALAESLQIVAAFITAQLAIPTPRVWTPDEFLRELMAHPGQEYRATSSSECTIHPQLFRYTPVLGVMRKEMKSGSNWYHDALYFRPGITYTEVLDPPAPAKREPLAEWRECTKAEAFAAEAAGFEAQAVHVLVWYSPSSYHYDSVTGGYAFRTKMPKAAT